MNVWLSQVANHREFVSALGVGLLCGCVGVFIDIDHPISKWITGKIYRAIHIPLAIVSIGVIVYISTRY